MGHSLQALSAGSSWCPGMGRPDLSSHLVSGNLSLVSSSKKEKQLQVFTEAIGILLFVTGSVHYDHVAAIQVYYPAIDIALIHRTSFQPSSFTYAQFKGSNP